MEMRPIPQKKEEAGGAGGDDEDKFISVLEVSLFLKNGCADANRRGWCYTSICAHTGAHIVHVQVRYADALHCNWSYTVHPSFKDFAEPTPANRFPGVPRQRLLVE